MGDLYERASELDELTAAVDGAAAGAGCLVVVEGPPGIGKTRLIEAAREHGRSGGLLVLSARGSELERQFPYGAVRQLFEPAIAAAGPAEREELLAGPAARLTAHFGLEAAAQLPSGAEESFPVLHGLYWLALNLSARGPVVMTVDDLHWTDSPSLRFVSYLARRLEGVPLALILGTRPDEPGADEELISNLTLDPLARVLRPKPLSVEAAGRVVCDSYDEAAPEFVEACHEATGGNPLLLRELARTAREEGVSATASDASRVLEIGPQGVSRAVRARLTRLPPGALELAESAAVLGDGADLRHAAALAGMDELGARACVDELVRVNLLEPGDTLEFAHPTLRAAVYAGIEPSLRVAAHARAARTLEETGASSEKIAAHLLRTPPSGDEHVAGLLRKTARRSLANGCADVAVEYLRRALDERAENQRAVVLHELGMAEATLDGPASVEHLKEALEMTSEIAARGEIAFALASRLLFTGRPREAIDVARRAMGEIGESDEDLRNRLEAFVFNVAMMDAELCGTADEIAARVRELPPGAVPGRLMLDALLAYRDARAARGRDAAISLADRSLAGRVLLETDNGGVSFACAVWALMLADSPVAISVLEEALTEGRRTGSLFAVASADVFLCFAHLLRGDLCASISHGEEAVEGIAAHRSPLALGYPTAWLAEGLMARGDLDGAAAALERSGLGPDGTLPETTHVLWVLAARARLRVLRGDVEQGVETWLECGRRYEAVGGRNSGLVPWRTEAALGLLRLGRVGEARDLAAEELDIAREWGGPRMLGRALRVAGLTRHGEPGHIDLLAESVDVLEGQVALLELAESLTELGAALRRGNRRSAARDPLSRAVELTLACDAVPLRERALQELVATGARPRRLHLSGVQSLTPSELRVAQLVAQGRTNREVAQLLFVTPKTVEVHLTGVYRKLGISSRAQLPEALSEASLGDAEPVAGRP